MAETLSYIIVLYKYLVITQCYNIRASLQRRDNISVALYAVGSDSLPMKMMSLSFLMMNKNG